MSLYELSVKIECDERPRALDVVEAMDKATLGKTYDVQITAVNPGEGGGDVVSVVTVPAYMAICRHCPWKFRYDNKAQAARFAGMHREQKHGDD